MKATKWFALALSAGMLAIMGCSDKDPVSSTSGAPDDASAAKLVMTKNKAAGLCNVPGCRPGFGGGGATITRPRPAPAPEPETPATTPKTLTATLTGGATMEFVWIEPGTYTMGSPESEQPDRNSNEGPQHQVTISKGFYLGKYEITQAQWQAVMGTTPWSGQSRVQANPNHPAVYISWDDMQAFVQELNDATGAAIYRLPTEAEWEYAARAGTMTLWSFGDDESQLGEYAWYSGNMLGVGYAQAVGTKLPNPWGLYDMHGNVSEWCQDWLDSYSSSPQTDPTGSFSIFAIRGGVFNNPAGRTRSAYRDASSPTVQYAWLGARLVRTQ